MALATTSRQAVWYLHAFTQLAYTIRITIMADNSSSINVGENPINNPRTKHIDVAYHLTREHLIRKCFSLSYIPSDDNTSNLMTKGLNSVEHHVHTQRLGWSEWERVLRHTFCLICWVNTMVLTSLITLLFRYTVTLFLILCHNLSIVFYMFLVWLHSLLRCILLTQINLFWSWLYLSHTLFLFPTLSYFILHDFIPYLNRIPHCYIPLQLV